MEDEVLFGQPSVVCEFVETSAQPTYPRSQSDIRWADANYKLY
jgi:hypothetical protein